MKRLWTGLGVVAVVVAIGLVIWKPWRAPADPLAGLTWGEVTRGDLAVVVSSTGSLEALDSVEVGSQVSGTLAEVRADFNDRVKKGQVLAVIDPALLDAALRDAEAGTKRAQAQLDQAKSDLDRRRELLAAGLVPESEFHSYETALVAAEASYDSAVAQRERARENRRNAVIVSPIDGVVVERAVDAGQTVAASFNTPRLFLLARDLERMRILAEVDEADIGQIRVGQSATFSVAAYPDESFTGEVAQVRLQPTVEQNVVKYTVVVDTGNPGGRLLPGMTATIDFLVETAKDVLSVPAAATRVQPTAAMQAVLDARRAERQAARGGSGSSASSGASSATATGRGGFGAGGGQMPSDLRRLWIRGADGLLALRMVRVGLSDGRRIEIRPLGDELEPGTAVVVAVPAGDAASTSTSRGPRGFRVL